MLWHPSSFGKLCRYPYLDLDLENTIRVVLL